MLMKEFLLMPSFQPCLSSLRKTTSLIHYKYEKCFRSNCCKNEELPPLCVLMHGCMVMIMLIGHKNMLQYLSFGRNDSTKLTGEVAR